MVGPEQGPLRLPHLVEELPDAAGADAAFIALIGEDGTEIETVLVSASGFAQCKPSQLAGEKLDDWAWLRNRLGHLRVVEVADTLSGPQPARDDLERRVHDLKLTRQVTMQSLPSIRLVHDVFEFARRLHQLVPGVRLGLDGVRQEPVDQNRAIRRDTDGCGDTPSVGVV